MSLHFHAGHYTFISQIKVCVVTSFILHSGYIVLSSAIKSDRLWTIRDFVYVIFTTLSDLGSFSACRDRFLICMSCVHAWLKQRSRSSIWSKALKKSEFNSIWIYIYIYILFFINYFNNTDFQYRTDMICEANSKALHCSYFARPFSFPQILINLTYCIILYLCPVYMYIC